jgi:hypothetical protein
VQEIDGESLLRSCIPSILEESGYNGIKREALARVALETEVRGIRCADPFHAMSRRVPRSCARRNVKNKPRSDLSGGAVLRVSG